MHNANALESLTPAAVALFRSLAHGAKLRSTGGGYRLIGGAGMCNHRIACKTVDQVLEAGLYELGDFTPKGRLAVAALGIPALVTYF